MKKWLFSTNYKDIGILYYMGMLMVMGSSMWIIISMELNSPGFLTDNDQIFYSIITPHAFIIT